MRTFFLIVFGTAFCILAIGSSYLIYRLNLILPENSAPTQAEYPQAALDLFKLTNSKLPDSMPEWMNFSSLAARRLLLRLPPEEYSRVEQNWYKNFYLASIWVGLRWSEREKLNTILDEWGYGPHYEWQGLERGAQEFFGVSAAELSLPELAVLIVNVQRGPSGNPWCARQVVEAKALNLLERYQQSFPDAKFDPDLMFSRLKPAPIECKS